MQEAQQKEANEKSPGQKTCSGGCVFLYGDLKQQDIKESPEELAIGAAANKKRQYD